MGAKKKATSLSIIAGEGGIERILSLGGAVVEISAPSLQVNIPQAEGPPGWG